MSNVETFYIDGPMVYVSKPLRQLITSYDKKWFGLQHVIRYTRWNDIEDYELLLYVILTDHIDVRSRRDSFQGKLKFFLTYEETTYFTQELLKIAENIIGSLSAGVSSNTYSIPVKNYNIKFQGVISDRGMPVVNLVIEKVHDVTGYITLSYSKFQELIVALNSIRNNWHATLTTVSYQFDRLGKSIITLQRKLSSLKQELNELKALVQTRSIETKQETVSNQEEVQLEEKNESQVQTVGSPKAVVPAKVITRTVQQKQTETKQEDITTSIISKVDKIVKKQRDKVPLSLIDDVRYLKDYLLNEEDLYAFVTKHKETLIKILRDSEIPEEFYKDDASLFNTIFELKNLFLGNEPTNPTAYILQSFVA